MHLKRVKIKKVIDGLKRGNQLYLAVEKAGIAWSTWFYWEAKLPRLEKLRRAAQERCENFRNTLVEDSFFKRFTNGDATPTDFIFYLTNRMPDRWKDKRAVFNNTNIANFKVNELDPKFDNPDDRAGIEAAREYLRKSLPRPS